MNHRNIKSRIQNLDKLRTACLVALLAVPLAACSDRPADTDDEESAQLSAQEAARNTEVERREGKEEPPLPANPNEAGDADDQYSEPRESWTGEGTAKNAEFQGSAENDARAEQLLKEEFSTRDELRAIEVDVENGVAVLKGEVGSVLDRIQAGSLAETIEGVVTVSNELQVASGSD